AGPLLSGSPTDHLAVDKSPIPATHIAHLRVRRIDFEHAVMARDIQMAAVPGQLNVAVVRPADDTMGALLEDVFLVFVISLGNGECDSRGLHGSPPSRRRTGGPTFAQDPRTVVHVLCQYWFRVPGRPRSRRGQGRVPPGPVGDGAVGR